MFFEQTHNRNSKQWIQSTFVPYKYPNNIERKGNQKKTSRVSVEDLNSREERDQNKIKYRKSKNIKSELGEDCTGEAQKH